MMVVDAWLARHSPMFTGEWGSQDVTAERIGQHLSLVDTLHGETGSAAQQVQIQGELFP
jgi:hypothetical protein